MKLEQTAIEWAHYTFNPWRGCTKVSEGCANCYAEVLSRRNPATLGEWGPGRPRVLAADAMWRSPLKWEEDSGFFVTCTFCGWSGDQRKRSPDECQCHYRWQIKTRPRVFCASMSDVFDPEVPTEWRQRLLQLIDHTPHLDWLLLTKRPEQIEPLMQAAMHGNFERDKTFAVHMPNVWLGTSAENHARAVERIPVLCDIPATVHFVSCEPLLGLVNLDALDDVDGNRFNALTGAWGVEGRGWTEPDPSRAINWVIAGGESGGEARPMHPVWARSLRNQCHNAGVPFLFKQWGEWAPNQCHNAGVPFLFKQWGEWAPTTVAGYDQLPADKRLRGYRYADGRLMLRVGKKVAGRELDGRVWNESPQGKGVVCG